MKNIHKRKNLMGIIYAIVMCIPFFTILVRCLYVQLNKNAYQSYSNFNSTLTEYRQINSYDSMIVGNTYKLISNNLENSDLKTSTNGIMLVDNVVVETSSRALTQSQIDGINSILLYKYNNNTIVRLNNPTETIQDYGLNSHYITCTFRFLGFSGVDTNNTFTYYFDGCFYENALTNTTNTLDNAFEYSLNEITKNNNIGRLNLVNWFAGVFLDMNNSHNALYLNFVNWYMNYSLFVSCVYLLYLVLMWFLCLARRILSKGFKDEL